MAPISVMGRGWKASDSGPGRFGFLGFLWTRWGL